MQEISLYQGFFANFYDTYVRYNFDIDIYCKLAGLYGSNILELGCGSGRIMIPLLKKDLNIIGIDNSEDMISLLYQKAAGIQKKPTIILSDIMEYTGNESFDIVILAEGTLCLFHTTQEKIKVFMNAYQSLRKGGIFVFNYLDVNIKSGVSYEKSPRYFFNKKEKKYIIILEKLDIENQKTILNFYGEEFIEPNISNRYIGKAVNVLLNKEVIDDVIKETAFLKEETISMPSNEGVMCFQILKKP